MSVPDFWRYPEGICWLHPSPVFCLSFKVYVWYGMCGAGRRRDSEKKKILPPFMFVLNTVVKIALGVCITMLSQEIIGRESACAASLCRACKNLRHTQKRGLGDSSVKETACWANMRTGSRSPGPTKSDATVCVCNASTPIVRCNAEVESWKLTGQLVANKVEGEDRHPRLPSVLCIHARAYERLYLHR